jgi:hypothetical protein
MQIKKCSCGKILTEKCVEVIGLQKGKSFDLILMQCRHCNTCVSLRVDDNGIKKDQPQLRAG